MRSLPESVIQGGKRTSSGSAKEALDQHRMPLKRVEAFRGWWNVSMWAHDHWRRPLTFSSVLNNRQKLNVRESN